MSFKSHSFGLIGVLLCTFSPSPALRAQNLTGKNAEEAFKNIQVFKGVPDNQIFPAMQFMAASLGVECEFCHVEHKFEADDKPAKATARRMIAMTMAINKESFNGRKEVTCFTCHQGGEHPAGTPPVMTSDAEPARAEKANAASGPAITADQILEKYVAAVGGAAALHRVSSRVATGVISAGGHDSPIELFTKAPDKRISVTHMGSGESITAFDGQKGWLGGGAGHPAREMSAPESEAARLDADFYFPIHIKEIFTGFRVGRPDKIEEKPVYTLICTRQGPPVRLYFDQASGLLLRQVRFADTPIGRNPTQIDYADYRELDGVKIPFRWTLSRVNGRFTIQLQDVKQNVPVEDSKFMKP